MCFFSRYHVPVQSWMVCKCITNKWNNYYIKKFIIYLNYFNYSCTDIFWISSFSLCTRWESKISVLTSKSNRNFCVYVVMLEDFESYYWKKKISLGKWSKQKKNAKIRLHYSSISLWDFIDSRSSWAVWWE